MLATKSFCEFHNHISYGLAHCLGEVKNPVMWSKQIAFIANCISDIKNFQKENMVVWHPRTNLNEQFTT
jgi:hypothetical protein